MFRNTEEFKARDCYLYAHASNLTPGIDYPERNFLIPPDKCRGSTVNVTAVYIIFAVFAAKVSYKILSGRHASGNAEISVP